MKKEHVENDNFESKAESSEEKENQEKTAEKVEAEDNSRSIAEKIAADASLKAIFDGISICNKELLSVLQRHGVNPVKAEKGMPFDPNFHQAMCEVEVKDAAPGKIVEIFQKGYKYNERLLRPSMVSVSKKQ